MAIDTTSPRTRRALLMGALGATVASVAATVGRASPVSATNGDAVRVGHRYSSTSATRIDGSGPANGFWGTSVSGIGVRGDSDQNIAVYGSTTSGLAFNGEANGTGIAFVGNTLDGVAVQAHSTHNNAISATSFISDKAVILAVSNGYTAVQGQSYDSFGVDAPAGPAKTGVYGYAAQDDSARGVTGETTAGRGVNGIATSGTGVFGKSNSGEGMRGVSDDSNGTAGRSASGIASGVYGENTAGGFGTYGRSNVGSAGSGVFGESTAGTGVGAATTTGVALRATSSGAGMAMEANGRVAFSTSGLVTVAVGSETKTVALGANLVAGSVVLCTLESGQPHLAIQRVIKNTTANTFTVYLSAAVAAGNIAKVGWFVIG